MNKYFTKSVYIYVISLIIIKNGISLFFEQISICRVIIIQKQKLFCCFLKTKLNERKVIEKIVFMLLVVGSYCRYVKCSVEYFQKCGIIYFCKYVTVVKIIPEN